MLSDEDGALERYTNHLEGAFALIKSRTQKKQWDETTLEIARHLRPQLVRTRCTTASHEWLTTR